MGPPLAFLQASGNLPEAPAGHLLIHITHQQEAGLAQANHATPGTGRWRQLSPAKPRTRWRERKRLDPWKCTFRDSLQNDPTRGGSQAGRGWGVPQNTGPVVFEVVKSLKKKKGRRK